MLAAPAPMSTSALSGIVANEKIGRVRRDFLRSTMFWALPRKRQFVVLKRALALNGLSISRTDADSTPILFDPLHLTSKRETLAPTNTKLDAFAFPLDAVV